MLYEINNNFIVRWYRSHITHRLGLLCNRCNAAVVIRVSKTRLFRMLEEGLMVQEAFPPRFYSAPKRELIMQWYLKAVGSAHYYMCEDCWPSLDIDEPVIGGA